MLAMLRSSLADITKTMAALQRKVGPGAIVRSDQLAAARQAILQQMAEIWTKSGDFIKANRALAAAAGVDSVSLYDSLLFDAAEKAGILSASQYDLFVDGMKAYASNAIDIGQARLTTSAIQLSSNVYKAQALSTGQLDDLLNAMLTRGTSAREIASAVKGFVNPDVPGGVSYSALRLGRTELNNAFHAAQAITMDSQPWVNAVEWNLSGSHPLPDECDNYASDTSYNGEAGQYATGAVPGNPHPLCLCFLTPVLQSTESFLQSLNSGAYDDVFASHS